MKRYIRASSVVTKFVAILTNSALDEIDSHISFDPTLPGYVVYQSADASKPIQSTFQTHADLFNRLNLPDHILRTLDVYLGTIGPRGRIEITKGYPVNTMKQFDEWPEELRSLSYKLSDI